MSEEATHATGESLKNNVAGTVKEKAGEVFGKDDLAQEGRAQQDRADDQGEVAKHEEKAEEAKAQSREDMERQRSAADGGEEY